MGPAPDGRIAGPLPHSRRATVNPRRELVILLPGMAPNAPKRNVLVGYGYLFVTTLALTVIHLI